MLHRSRRSGVFLKAKATRRPGEHSRYVAKLVNKADKTKYLEDMDEMLTTLGFHRRRNHQEWKHRVDSANELWIHINLGRSVVNPSMGVKYLDLVDLFPQGVGVVTGTMIMLSSLWKPPRLYTIEEGSLPVAHDFHDKGLSMFPHLRNREFVIEALKSNLVSDWPVASYSDRIRLLPILLANQGRLSEAFYLLERFRSESLGRDQILPGYEVFAESFGKRYAT
jgi:hypothetical protein